MLLPNNSSPSWKTIDPVSRARIRAVHETNKLSDEFRHDEKSLAWFYRTFRSKRKNKSKIIAHISPDKMKLTPPLHNPTQIQ